ncbi:MAG: hypothetical protein AAFM92_06895 [Pseudomonadota bacterium]
MGVILIGLLLLGAGVAWLARSAMSEIALSWLCAVLYGFAAFLAWIAYGGGALAQAVLLSPWIESGSLSTEIVLEPGATGLLFIALTLTLGALSQVMVHDLPVLAQKPKVRADGKARLSVIHGLFLAAALLFFAATDTVQMLGGLLLMAWFGSQLAGFDYRSQAAGRAAQRVLVPLLLAVLVLALAAAALFAGRDGAGFEILFAEPLTGETSAFGRAALLGSVASLAILLSAAILLGLLFAHVWLAETALTPTPAMPLLPIVCALAAYWLIDTHGTVLTDAHRALLAALGTISAVVLAALAILQQEIRRSVALLAGSVGGIVALMLALGFADIALAHLLAQASCLALLLWGVSSIATRGDECDLWQLGGRKAAFRTHYGAMLVGAAGLSGLGLPFPYDGAVLGLGGFASTGVLLSALHGTGYFTPVIAALVLTSFAIWRVIVMTFEGNPRSTLPEDIAEPSVTRGVLIAAGFLVVLTTLWVPDPASIAAPTWVSAVPLICFAAGLTLAAFFFVLRLGWAKALSRRLPAPGGALAAETLVGALIKRPAGWAGETLGHKLDASGLDALMLRLARSLHPSLTQLWARFNAGRTAPYAITALVGLVLLSTILAMVGA